MTLNILHTETRDSGGGQAMRVLEDLKMIREMGHRPFLACKPHAWLLEAARKENIPTVPIPFRHIFDPKSIFKLYETVSRNGIDIIHSHSSEDSYASFLVAKMTGKKIVRSRHTEFTKKPGMIYRNADFLVTTGERLRRNLIEAGIKEAKVLSIPSYPDMRRFHPDEEMRTKLRERYGLKEKIVLGAMTGMRKNKRPLNLLPVLKNLVSSYPNLHLLIAGSGTTESENEFFSKVKGMHLENHVNFLGFCIPEHFLNAVDIYVCPSKKEGVPQAIMQAMMMGIPVVSTDVGSIRDLNVENNLFLAEKEDFVTFEKYVSRLVEDSALRHTTGKKNAEIAREHFERHIALKKLQTVYESLIQ